MDLETVWKIREEDIYPSLFGRKSRGIFPLETALFYDQFQQTEIDPRWLFYGVIEYEPTEARPSWLYVTSAHSNPWNVEPENYRMDCKSGEGVEFVFETTEQNDWAIRRLQSLLAFDILLSIGRYKNKNSLCIYDRIPLRSPLNGSADCVLRNLIVTEPEHFKNTFVLPSGHVQLLSFTAISDIELSYTKEHGSDLFMKRFKETEHYPVNDPNRESTL